MEIKSTKGFPETIFYYGNNSDIPTNTYIVYNEKEKSEVKRKIKEKSRKLTEKKNEEEEEEEEEDESRES